MNVDMSDSKARLTDLTDFSLSWGHTNWLTFFEL